MNVSSYLYSFFNRNNAPAPLVADAPLSTPLPKRAPLIPLPVAAEPTDSTAVISTIRPYWLSDADLLRDEGVLFGLSDAQPDEKVADIQAYFRQQAIPIELQREQAAAAGAEINRLIGRHTDETDELQKRIRDLTSSHPVEDNLLRQLVSLSASTAMCIGTFFLIDKTLYPVFVNHWIALGVFLAGMFNLSGRTSFFYEEGSTLTGRRAIEEIGLPFAASVFVFVYAEQTQSLVQAIALFVFVLFLFLLAGKLFLNTLTRLENDLIHIRLDRQRAADRQQYLPGWERQAMQLAHETDELRMQLLQTTTAVHRAEAALAGLNAQRDQLVNLFLSEFELARSLRYRLSEQQRQAIIHR